MSSTLSPGSLYHYQGRQYQLEAVLGESELLGRDLESGARAVHPIDAHPGWARPATGRTHHARRVGGAVQRKETLRVHMYLKGVAQCNVGFLPNADTQRAIDQFAAKPEDPSPPSNHTLYDWARKWWRSGGVSEGIASRSHERGGKGGSRLHPACEALIQAEIDKLLTPRDSKLRQESITEVLGRINERIRAHNAEGLALGVEADWPLVSSATFYRRYALRPEYDKVRAKYGKAYADRLFQMSQHDPATDPERALQLGELDHTTLNVIVRDALTGERIGRPTLTALICVTTRMVPGWQIGLRPPRTDAVLQTLRHAMLDKTPKDAAVIAELGVNPCQGLIEFWRTDRASEMKTPEVEKACDTLLIAYELCPARRPELKPHIERFFKTVKETFIATLPGATLSIRIRGKEVEVKDTGLTLEELQREFERWLNRVYAQMPHEGLYKASPLTAWQRCCRLHPPQPVGAAAVIHATRPTDQYSLSKSGLRMFGNQRYASRELNTWRHQYGAKLKVVVRVDTEDIGHVWVEHPGTGLEYEVSNVCPTYAKGVTLKAHDLARKLKLFRNRDLAQERDASKARADLAAVLADLAASPRMRDRQRAAAARPTSPKAHDVPPSAASTRTPGSDDVPFDAADLGDELQTVDGSTSLYDDDVGPL